MLLAARAESERRSEEKKAGQDGCRAKLLTQKSRQQGEDGEKTAASDIDLIALFNFEGEATSSDFNYFSTFVPGSIVVLERDLLAEM